MQLKTILNRVTKYKSFVVGQIRLIEAGGNVTVEVDIHPRANGRPVCSCCGKPGPGYDQAAELRRFEFVPLWLIANTTTRTGLTVEAAIDTNRYPTKIKVTDAHLRALRLKPHEFPGEWNYTLSPRT